MSDEIKQISRVLARAGENKYVIFCEACGHGHILDERWSFNNDLENPTFSPSLLVRTGHYAEDKRKEDCYVCTQRPESKNFCTICHSFIRNGYIEYLDDCTHEYAGKTVLLSDFNKWND